MSATPVGPGPRAERARSRERVDVLGIKVACVDMPTAIDTLATEIRTGSRAHVCVSDVNALLNAAADPELTRLYNSAVMTLPDGVPLVWAGRWAGSGDIARVAGPDLLAEVMAVSAERGWSSYFFGGADGVAEELARRFTAAHPGLTIAGTSSPPFRELTKAEDDAVVAEINDSGADIVWVGLGAPKQERWMAAHRDRLTAPVLIGVGAAFDFHSGRLDRAPGWMQRSGLEWSYRLYKEPRRLWRRYAVGIPRFALGVARHRPRLVRERV